MKNKEYKTITHTFIPPFIDRYSKVLILGSLPSVKSIEAGFYYSHKQNRFYKVISSIYNEDNPISIEDKKSLLKKHHIALYDVIESCDIIGSSDASIKNVKPADINGLLTNYPHITSIIITGNMAKRLFDKYVLPSINKSISIHYCSSTSPANARVSIETLTNEYKEALFINEI